MLLLPDFYILRVLWSSNVFYICGIFILLMINVYCWRSYLRPKENFLDRTISFLIVLFVLVQFHLVAALCIVLLFLFHYSKEQFTIGPSTKRAFGLIGFLVTSSLIVVAAMKILPATSDSYPLSVVAVFRKLYNYPLVFEKVLKPIFKVGPPFIFVAGGISILALPFLNRSYSNRKPIVFILLLTILSVSLIGVARSYYNHIRYTYFMVPAFLFSTAALANIVREKISSRLKFNIVFWIILIFAGAIQAFTALKYVILVQPGQIEKYTPHRVYLDFKTCAEIINREFSSDDYIVSLGSTHQASVYLKHPIQAAIRPKLREYAGARNHYITGSLFFDEKYELIDILQSIEFKSNANIWILLGKNYLKADSWQSDLSKKIESHIVCRAKDKINSLAKIPASELMMLLD